MRNVKRETQDTHKHRMDDFWRLQPLFDFFDLVALENVFLLEVVVVLQTDTALKALGHVANVVLESLEAGDLAIEHHNRVAHQADLGGSNNPYFGDLPSGDGHAFYL